MSIRVAQKWYETQPFSDEVTLIREAHVHPDLRCNMWHIRGRQCDVLIDSGLGVVPLRQEIAALSERTVLAVASHTHFDHIGGHHEFEHRLCHAAEAEVLAHPDDRNTVWDSYRSQLDAEASFSALPFEGFAPDGYAVTPAPPSRLIGEGDVIDLGDRVLQVFHMPGHSPGSLCLLEEATGTLFTGDVLYDGELLDSLYHSDPDIYLETLARLKEIPAKVFHCGHYRSFGHKRMLELIGQYESKRQRRH